MKSIHRPALLSLAAIALLVAGCGVGEASDFDGGLGGASSDDGASSGAGDGSAGQACVDAINGYRTSLGLAPYTRWTAEESCADDQAESDGTASSPHGAFGQCHELAQNECPGWPGPPESMISGCLEMMWAEGPGDDFAKHGHYINMSNPSYTQVSCGFHTFADGKVWAVQDFK